LSKLYLDNLYEIHSNIHVVYSLFTFVDLEGVVEEASLLQVYVLQINLLQFSLVQQQHNLRSLVVLRLFRP
jgi:hypothetical protein